MPDENGRNRLGELVQDIDIAMLTTFDDDGQLHSRPMLTLSAGADGILWFATDLRSHSAADIGREHQVAVSYVDPTAQRYLSVSGWAELVRDRSRARAFWRDALRAWFPDGPEARDFALMRVAVERAQYWDGASGEQVQLIAAPVARYGPERYASEDASSLGPH